MAVGRSDRTKVKSDIQFELIVAANIRKCMSGFAWLYPTYL